MTSTRLLITAVVVEDRPVREVAAQYGVSTSWLYELLARYRREGEAVLEPRSRRLASNPNAKWLRAQLHQPATITDLQTLPNAFAEEDDQRRPHRSLPHPATPATVYTSRPKATPGDRTDDTDDRTRHARSTRRQDPAPRRPALLHRHRPNPRPNPRHDALTFIVVVGVTAGAQR